MEIVKQTHLVGNMFSTAYVLVDDKTGVTIIDTGPGHFGRKILAYLKTIGRSPADVSRIILTHRHFDHIGGAAELRSATRAKVYAHPLDAPQIIGAEPMRWPKGALGAAMKVVGPIVFPFAPCPVDEDLADGMELDLGSLGILRTVQTPGHTIGHCSFYLPARNMLISGDALNNASGTPSAPMDAVNDDTHMTHETVLAIAQKFSTIESLVFGHGAPVIGSGAQALQKSAELSAAALKKEQKK